MTASQPLSMMASYSCILILLLCLVMAEIFGLSSKGKKFESFGYDGFGKLERWEKSTTEDPFFTLDMEGTEPVPALNDDLFGNDDFFNDLDGDIFNFGELLPPCTALSPMEVEMGTSCSNVSSESQAIRHKDPVFERLISQIFFDYQLQLNNEAKINGQVIDPLEIDRHLPKPIDIKQNGNGYSAHVKMHSLKMFGLSNIRLADVEVTRSENLTDMELMIKFNFEELLINGTYSLEGTVGWWQIDSVGERKFEIRMVGANLTYGMVLRLVDSYSDFMALQCEDRAGHLDESVLITEIKLPLEYDDINFRFENLGSFANTMVNAIGLYIMETQEEAVADRIRQLIKGNVNSLIC